MPETAIWRRRSRSASLDSMRLFALVDSSLPEPIEVYVRRGDAERTLAELLRDEPGWESLLSIEEIDIDDPSRN
jgi:hypothetical protein